jgi:hypothetical protein
MLDKKYIKEEVKRLFPDLVNTNITLNDRVSDLFFENTLLPFLIFQNTVDVNHRLIGLFMPEASSSNHLVPFYVILGQYRKALNKIMSSQSFQSESYEANQKQIVINGNISSIISADFMNRQLVTRSGDGRELTVPFLESYKLNWNYRSAIDIRNRLEAFEKIDKSGSGNIFNVPIAPKQHDYEGVIIFTNTSKFESLLKNVKVSGSNLKEYLNIEKVVFTHDQNIQFVRVSQNQTKSKPVSVLIARQDAFRSYENIINAGNGKLNHIRTIIIDDFDDLINSWERNSCLQDELFWLSINYFQKLQRKELKDIYLITKNSRIDIHEILISSDIKYNPWLLLPLEDKQIEHLQPSVTIIGINEKKLGNLLDDITQLAYRWKTLAQVNFCQGEILKPIYGLYELKTRLNTFFDLKSLREFVINYIDSLNELRHRWFFSGSDFNVINDTIKFMRDEIINREPVNYKVEALCKSIEKCKTTGKCVIVGDNGNINDSLWLNEFMCNKFNQIEFRYVQGREFNSSRDIVFGEELESIYYLTANKKIIAKALGNILAVNQVFILDGKAFSFTEYYTRKLRNIQSEIAIDIIRYSLLNIEAPLDKTETLKEGLLELNISSEMKAYLYQDEFDSFETSEIQQLVEQILEPKVSKSPHIEDNYLLFFSDGTILPLAGSRNVFIYEDDQIHNNYEIDNLTKSVKYLESDEQIILPRRDLEVKDLINDALKKNPHFSEMLKTDEKWRDLIKYFISSEQIDIRHFRARLKEYGFSISTDVSISDWIEGERRRPQKFRKLLTTLSELKIIDEKDIEVYNKCNYEIKSIQIKFIRIAIKKLISKLNGIELIDDSLFTDDILNDFIDHIDIKKIISIYKL